MGKVDLKIDWATYEAAKYAVEHWHYSHCMPRSKQAKLAVWEDGKFVGAILFGLGAGNLTKGKRFGLKECFEVAELMRVALREHKSETSRIVAIALKLLRKQSPGLRLIISLADPREGHVGGIYQAGNWVYIGTTEDQIRYFDENGKEHHPRHLHPSGYKNHWGKPVKCLKPADCRKETFPGKHKYLMPLDDEMRKRIEPLRKPYPKRPKQAMESAQDSQREGSAHPDAPKKMTDAFPGIEIRRVE